MSARLLPIGLLLLIALAGCGSRDSANDQPTQADGLCNADAVQDMRGQFASAEAEMIQRLSCG